MVPQIWKPFVENNMHMAIYTPHGIINEGCNNLWAMMTTDDFSINFWAKSYSSDMLLVVVFIISILIIIALFCVSQCTPVYDVHNGRMWEGPKLPSYLWQVYSLSQLSGVLVSFPLWNQLKQNHWRELTLQSCLCQDYLLSPLDSISIFLWTYFNLLNH